MVEWKMLRGVWRPRNKQLVESNAAEQVQSLSTESFTLARTNPKKALMLLTLLKGVGPALASAVLSCLVPEMYPFMSDEALQSCGLSLKYTPAIYAQFLDLIQTKAKALHWKANDVQNALWATCITSTSIAAKAKPATPRRKSGKSGSSPETLVPDTSFTPETPQAGDGEKSASLLGKRKAPLSSPKPKSRRKR